MLTQTLNCFKLVLESAAALRDSPMNLKASVTRVFGYVAVFLGFCTAFCVFYVLSWQDRGFRPYFLATLLVLLLAANLIYVGWHAIVRGSIPIRPKAPFHWRDLNRLRSSIFPVTRFSIGKSRYQATLAMLIVVIIFAAFGFAGARIAVSYSEWVARLHESYLQDFNSAPLSPAIERLRHSVEEHINFQWLIWVFEFPVGMCAAMLGAMTLGILRWRRPTYLLGAVGLILVANAAGFLLLALLLALFWPFVFGIPVFGFLLLAPGFAAHIIVLAVAQAALNARSAQSSVHEPHCLVTPSRFAGHLLLTLPIGILLGITLNSLYHSHEWLIPGIQITWGSVLGISLLQPKPPVTQPARS